MKKRFFCAVLCLVLVFGACAKNVPSTNVSSGISEAESSAIAIVDSSRHTYSTQTDSNLHKTTEKFEFDCISFNLLNPDSVTSVTDHRSWKNRLPYVIDFLANSNCNIICLQEMRFEYLIDILPKLKDKYSYVYPFEEAIGQDLGLAIFYDKSLFSAVETELFWLSDTSEVFSNTWGAYYPRKCISAVLEHIPSGNKIKVYNTHFDHVSQYSREKSAALVAERALESGLPAVIAGDFNCTYENLAYKTIISSGFNTCQNASDSDFGTTCHAFGSVGDNESDSIDHIFIRKNNMKATKFEICRDRGEGGIFLSDHYPVRATVEVTF